MQDIAGYKSIALDIAQRIVSGELTVNSRISGRSLLASQYHVSPETIRKAIGLLKDENIVTVSQGKEIFIVSERNAHEYVTKSGYMNTVYSLKQDLQLLLSEKKQLDHKFETLLGEIVNASDRMQNLKAYNPMEVTIREGSHASGKTIGNLQFWQNTGATVIALRRGTEVSISPGPHVILRDKDVLIVVGDSEAGRRTKEFVDLLRQEN